MCVYLVYGFLNYLPCCGGCRSTAYWVVSLAHWPPG